MRTVLAMLAIALLWPLSAAVAQSGGTLDRITVHGPSLEGNLEGDSADREVFVYLPPGYAAESEKRFPVVYALHGFTGTAEGFASARNLPERADAAIAAGAREVIIVIPDALTLHRGSMYSNSVTIGDWESFIADDLVGYVDANYRTIPKREARGMVGHSMGGYGTIRIGMKRPDVFSSLYLMSACCLSASKAEHPAFGEAEKFHSIEEIEALGMPGFVAYATSAAWSPNPNNPPYYFDPPTQDGVVQQDVLDRWAANAPNVMVHQYIPALKSYEAIAIDIGDADSLLAANERLHEILTDYQIVHTFEVYEGDHGNRITERFEKLVLPFFSEHLEAE